MNQTGAVKFKDALRQISKCTQRQNYVDRRIFAASELGANFLESFQFRLDAPNVRDTLGVAVNLNLRNETFNLVVAALNFFKLSVWLNKFGAVDSDKLAKSTRFSIADGPVSGSRISLSKECSNREIQTLSAVVKHNIGAGLKNLVQIITSSTNSDKHRTKKPAPYQRNFWYRTADKMRAPEIYPVRF